jgi:hypothetical protein
VARKRVRAAARKGAEREVRDEATVIADGVYHVARETIASTPRAELPLPVFVFAPVAYACEMMASAIVQRHEIPLERQHDVALYLLAGVTEVAVAAFGGFDPEHFEAWMAALKTQEDASE